MSEKREKYTVHIAAGLGGAILILIFLIIGLIICKVHDYVPIQIINPENVNLECLDKVESIRDLKENGLVLTPSEYTNNIAGFYNTIITFIIALFAAFSFITYRISKRNVQEQVNEEVKKILTEMMRDSKEFEINVLESLYGKFSEEYATVEQLQSLTDTISRLSSQINIDKDAESSENAIVE